MNGNQFMKNEKYHFNYVPHRRARDFYVAG